MAYQSWRDDPGLSSFNTYKKRFAFWPVICEDGTKVWWKNYYSTYRHWNVEYLIGDHSEDRRHHVDFTGHITEAEYIVRKLTENF